MIKLKDQFVCKISVNNFDDFILTEDLIDFSYMESAGLVIPYFSATFILRNQRVLKYLNEGNVVTLGMGRDELNLNSMQMRLISDITNRDYTLGSQITIKGVMHNPKFILLQREDNYTGSAISVMNQIASKYFTVISNVTKTNDSQDWYQTGISDRQMLRDIWLHSYIDDKTFIAVGFDNNTFRIKDIRKSLLEDDPWIFSMNKVPTSSSSKVINFGQFWTKNDYGAVNDCIGRGYESVLFNVDTGEIEIPESKLKNFTVNNSNKLNLAVNNVKKYSYNYINDEVSSNYILAGKQNIRNLMMFSNFKIFIPVSGPFRTFHVLDSVKIEETAVGARASGRCFITRIFYHIEDRRLYTNLTLCKEAPNEIQGDDLLET